jgi:5'-3' exonuclease
MIIVDYSHLSMRNLFTSIPKRPKFKTEDYIGVYFHQMIFSMQLIENYKKQGYGDIILALDSKSNWRKKAVKNYKGNRPKKRAASPVNFEEFYEMNDKLIDIFVNGFGLKSILVDDVEADDTGYVLSHLTDEKTLLITEDKDWVQNLIGNISVDIYKPIKKEFVKNSLQIQEKLRAERLIHCMIGDKVDDIPSIMDNLAYSNEFNSFLREKGIEVLEPIDFEKLSISDKLINEFENIHIDTKVKLYKPGRFGEKTALKIVNDSKREFIRKHKANMPRILDNFKRNRKLIDMIKIPSNYVESIINEYKNMKYSKNHDKVKTFFEDYSLHKLANNLCLNEVTSEHVQGDIMGFSSFSDMNFSNVKAVEKSQEDFSDWGF